MIFETYITACFFTVLLFSGIPLLLSSLSGVVVAVLQAATQIQEQSITYTVKFFTMAAAIALLGGWFISEIRAFIQEVLSESGFTGRCSLIPVEAFALFIRIFGAVMLLPLNGLLRGGLTKFFGAVGLTLLLLEQAPAIDSLTVAAGISELFIGIAIGLPLILVAELAKLWAELFETARGQNTAEVADPGAHLPASQLALLFRLAIWSYIVVGGALVTLVGNLSQSITLFQPGVVPFSVSIEVAQGVLKLVALGVKQTATLFLPLALVFLGTELSLGFISKVAPRLSLSNESVGIKSIIGFLFLFLVSKTGIVETISGLGQSTLALLPGQ